MESHGRLHPEETLHIEEEKIELLFEQNEFEVFGHCDEKEKLNLCCNHFFL